jgi:hypothetical protein
VLRRVRDPSRGKKCRLTASSLTYCALTFFGPWGSSHAWRDYRCYLLFAAFGLLFNILINTLICVFWPLAFSFLGFGISSLAREAYSF